MPGSVPEINQWLRRSLPTARQVPRITMLVVRPAGFEPATCGLASPLRLSPPINECEGTRDSAELGPIRNSALHIPNSLPFGGWTISSPSQARRVWPLRIPATRFRSTGFLGITRAISSCDFRIANGYVPINIHNSQIDIPTVSPIQRRSSCAFCGSAQALLSSRSTSSSRTSRPPD